MSETLIKDKTKTERFPTKVGNLNKKKEKNRTKTERSADFVRQTLKKEKTEQKQKGLLTASGRP